MGITGNRREFWNSPWCDQEGSDIRTEYLGCGELKSSASRIDVQLGLAQGYRAVGTRVSCCEARPDLRRYASLGDKPIFSRVDLGYFEIAETGYQTQITNYFLSDPTPAKLNPIETDNQGLLLFEN